MPATAKERKRNLALMRELVRYCTDRELFSDVHIYANGHRYSSERKPGAEPVEFTWRNRKYTCYDEGELDVADYVEYNNPDTVTMTFEGPLYSAYNGYDGNGFSVMERINGIFAKHGLYAEQGYAWSLAGYPC